MAETTIGTLRVRGAGEDTPALRLGLTSLLATGDLQPPTLPPAAILIVRRVADPLPRRLPARRRTVRIDRVWERATRDVLEQHYRRAHRPRRSGVPDNANAVLFGDEAELVACLVRDICSGGMHGRWWWKHVRVAIAADRSVALERVLSERATHVPAAFDQLHSSGELEEIVRTLTPDAARRTLTAIAYACECEALLAEIAATARPNDAAFAVAPTIPLEEIRSKSAEETLQLPTKSIAIRAAVSTPWQSVAPDVVVRASHPWRAALAGVAVALHRRASAVRTATFARTFGEWIAQAEVGATQASLSLPPREQSIAEARRHVDSQRVADKKRAAVLEPAKAADVHAETSRQAVQHAPLDEPIDEAVPLASAQRGKCAPDATTPRRVPLTGVAIATDLGGVFYLLNAMRHMNLPQSLGDNWPLASGVGAWGTLEAIAAGLLGDDFAATAGDGSWPVLADLDDRQPGTPVMALLSLGCAERLAHTLPSIRRRLAEGFGLPPDEESRAIGMLLRHRARVHLTSSHVDVTFPIDLVSLPVRMAGLDRDPGWMPAFGRVITFHYE